MLAKGCALCALLIAGASIAAGFTQVSALKLRQERQPLYWARHNTLRSGRYYNGSWQRLPARSSFGGFVGGGGGVGK